MTSPLDHAAEIAAWLAATDITTLELTGPDGQLRLQRNGTGGPIVAVEPVEPTVPAVPVTGDRVLSAYVGHLLHAHPLHDAPLVAPGETAAAGQAIALVRIGPLLLPVAAPRDGIVAAFDAAEGQLVGYGDIVATLNPS